MSEFDPAPVRFHYRNWPVESFFYELDIAFGDRIETVGGSEIFVGPEIELMRAVVCLLGAGRYEATAQFPAENDQFEMVLRLPGDPGHPYWREGLMDRPVQFDWREIDPEGFLLETRTLGFGQSLEQVARAILALGEARVWPDIAPSAALIALRAIIEPLADARPTR